MTQVSFEYLFDPLCGWCYASAPALQAVAQTWPDRLQLLPSGLFAEDGARPMTPAFAEYAWSNDQRIAAMTGQVFSPAYHQQVLQGSAAQRFDATAMTRALTAVHTAAPQCEPAVLHALQIARYVAGEDTSVAGVVARVTAASMQQTGHAWDAATLAHQLQHDPDLAQATRARIQTAQARMQALQIRGVPQLLIHVGDAVHVCDSSHLYRGGEHLVGALSEWLRELDAPAS